MAKSKTYSSFSDMWDGDGKYVGGSSTKSWSSPGRCYNTHPAMPLPGTDKVIFGGSCITPAVTDAEIYIGFDYGMKMSARSWPWKQGTEFLFKITDMNAPDSPEEFQKLVDWTLKQLDAGKKVHCGCIGGHGRTGTFLAALVSTLGEKDAINYVRKNYCQKAVESTAQIDFLAKHYGVTRASGSKSHGLSSKPAKSKTPAAAPRRFQQFAPMRDAGSIWGDLCS